VQRVHGWVGRNDRHPVEVDALVHRGDGTSTSVRLTNFSHEGCRIETDSDLQIGELLGIAISGMGQVRAQVRWALPGSAGAKFLDERAI
jgi:hypothetical protein